MLSSTQKSRHQETMLRYLPGKSFGQSWMEARVRLVGEDADTKTMLCSLAPLLWGPSRLPL